MNERLFSTYPSDHEEVYIPVEVVASGVVSGLAMPEVASSEVGIVTGESKMNKSYPS